MDYIIHKVVAAKLGDGRRRLGCMADPWSGRPVDGDTLFNVSSVTKAVAATASAIDGKLRAVLSI